VLQLLPDPDLPAPQEVDVRERQAERLPLPEAGAGTDDGERSIPGGQGVEERLDVLPPKGLDPLVQLDRQLDGEAGRPADEVVIDGQAKDGGEPPVAPVHRGRGKALGQPTYPCLDVGVPDPVDLPVAEGGEDVVPEIAATAAAVVSA